MTNIGVDIWCPRIRGTELDQQNIKIEIIPPLQAHPRCLVLLPMPWQPAANSSDGELLLGKMLNVLELNEHELAVAKIYSKNSELDAAAWQQVEATISELQPQWILQFAPDLPLCLGSGRGVKTLHPQHLLQYPQDKAKVYQDLLTLKKLLG